MKVVTISRQFGSNGDQIAEKVCQVLGWHLFDKTLLMQAAAEAGLSDQEVMDYTEENYKVKTFWDGLLGRPITLGQVKVWKEDVHGVRVYEEMDLTEDIVLLLVQKAIRVAYERGGFVIVGRGGQVLLRDCVEVVHVRVEAPMEERIQNIKQILKEGRQEYFATMDTRRAAQDQILSRDQASRDYIHRIYGEDWSDPNLYHMVLNTGRLNVPVAASMVVELVRHLE